MFQFRIQPLALDHKFVGVEWGGSTRATDPDTRRALRELASIEGRPGYGAKLPLARAVHPLNTRELSQAGFWVEERHRKGFTAALRAALREGFANWKPAQREWFALSVFAHEDSAAPTLQVTPWEDRDGEPGLCIDVRQPHIAATAFYRGAVVTSAYLHTSQTHADDLDAVAAVVEHLLRGHDSALVPFMVAYVLDAAK